MKLKEELINFYLKNNIPLDGGVDDKTFIVTFSNFNLRLPNLSWRKSKLHIHDLEHIVNKQDTSWKGEIYIASWEIAAGYWRFIPLCIFPFWTMGYGCWKSIVKVRSGFYKGITDRSITTLSIKKDELIEMDVNQLRNLIGNTGKKRSNMQKLFLFITSVTISQLIFLFPIIVAILFSLCILG